MASGVVQYDVVGHGSVLPGGLLVSRQPILDRERRVHAYQLRLHPLPADPHATMSPVAGVGSTTDALERCGLETLTRGRRAFMRMSAAQLQPAVRAVFPPGRVIVDVPADDVEAAIDLCETVREHGYQVALDDFVLDRDSERLVPLADYIKIDFLPSSSDHTRACVEAAKRAKAALVAKSVHASEVFDEAVREGFAYFQGQLFEQRRLPRGGSLDTGQLASLQILQALSDPNVTLDDLEDLVKRDAAVSFRILRFANSAAAAQSREVTSMRHALFLIGRDTVRRWASVAIVAGLGTASPDEVLTMAVVRARFCEMLASTVDEDAAGEGFLVGLCSLLDIILGRSMPDILDDLPLTADVRAALVGRDNRYRRLLDCAIAYERGEWTSCLSLSGLAGLDRRALAPAYLNSLQFAYAFLEQAGGQSAAN